MNLVPSREGLLDGLERLAEYRPSPVTRRVLGVAALLVFLVSLGVAFRHLPTLDLRPELLLVVAAGAAAVFGINAAELRITGHLSRRRLSWSDAAEKTLWATAANLLPVPGGSLIRLQAVADGPDGWSRATRCTLVPSTGWFAATFLAAGAALAYLGASAFALAALVLGLAGSLVTWLLMPPDRTSAETVLSLSALELGFVAASSLRLLALFAALGHPIDPVAAVVLTTAAVLATAAGVFPGGLGLRELLSATVAPLLGLPPSLAVLVSALDRVVGLGTVSLLTAVHQLVAPEVEPASG
ncbi:MAG: hypothetical protein Q8W44_07225 [Candidatus Palauibacterales bacterium]|nr:hypothetical protein [Candidatus Palauibacterales bacterium]